VHPQGVRVLLEWVYGPECPLEGCQSLRERAFGVLCQVKRGADSVISAPRQSVRSIHAGRRAKCRVAGLLDTVCGLSSRRQQPNTCCGAKLAFNPVPHVLNPARAFDKGRHGCCYLPTSVLPNRC
jgi:hypothetical protein